MKKVLLWGHTIFLAGLATALQGVAGLEVTCATSNLPDTTRRLAPDVVIVDFDTVDASGVLSLLRAHPDLHVMGVNPSTSAVTVLAGQVYLAETVEEVTRTICDF